MDDIIFVRTRYNYDSYTDFWKLVELSGFPFVYTDEVDFSKKVTYIISPMNGEWRPFMDSKSGNTGKRIVRDCKLFLWNLERPGSGGLRTYSYEQSRLIEEGYVDDVIVSDYRLASDCRLKYVPLGSHPGLGTPGEIQTKRFDFIHLSCYSNNRSWLFNAPDKPQSNICGYSIAPNGWGEERHQRLMQSKFMLNVHQDDTNYIEPLRFALAAAYGLPILSQECYDTQPYDSRYITQFAIGDFCKAANRLLGNYGKYYRSGFDLLHDMTQVFTFKRCLEMFL